MILSSSHLARCRIQLSQLAADQWDATRVLCQLKTNGDKRQVDMAIEVIALDGDLLQATHDYLRALAAS